ncbi:type IV pilus modification protein PilV [Uliginosibacterium sp. 31-16]|uniref:type IV pilus modification protein PilV n=1 Tax=Uliginosibacterium sp. 31-16 TaxID=3068315 RepID=UPI00273DFE5D|nr:type IV pilus modification protein PilV [Uliginosibacterium sp. 31-16]MDP5240739.1 type IV pilus modification protein PilV [Uliginosibacterium sp. 31-16]
MSSRKNSQGSTLIEVLIAVLVLSIGLLGAFKLQTEGVRLNADSKYTVIAASYAQDALDALSFNRLNDKTTWVSITSSSVGAGLSGRPGEWLMNLQRDLPDGNASIGCASKACTVEISWTPPGRDPVTAKYSMYDN